MTGSGSIAAILRGRRGGDPLAGSRRVGDRWLTRRRRAGDLGMGAWGRSGATGRIRFLNWMDPGGGPEGIWLWEGEMTVGAAAPIYFLRSSAEVDGRDAVLRGAGGAVDSAMGGLDLSSVLPL